MASKNKEKFTDDQLKKIEKAFLALANNRLKFYSLGEGVWKVEGVVYNVFTECFSFEGRECRGLDTLISLFVKKEDIVKTEDYRSFKELKKEKKEKK